MIQFPEKKYGDDTVGHGHVAVLAEILTRNPKLKAYVEVKFVNGIANLQSGEVGQLQFITSEGGINMTVHTEYENGEIFRGERATLKPNCDIEWVIHQPER